MLGGLQPPPPSRLVRLCGLSSIHNIKEQDGGNNGGTKCSVVSPEFLFFSFVISIHPALKCCLIGWILLICQYSERYSIYLPVFRTIKSIKVSLHNLSMDSTHSNHAWQQPPYWWSRIAYPHFWLDVLIEVHFTHSTLCAVVDWPVQ